MRTRILLYSREGLPPPSQPHRPHRVPRWCCHSSEDSPLYAWRARLRILRASRAPGSLSASSPCCARRGWCCLSAHCYTTASVSASVAACLARCCLCLHCSPCSHTLPGCPLCPLCTLLVLFSGLYPRRSVPSRSLFALKWLLHLVVSYCGRL